MKIIHLTKGQVAQVDDSDFDAMNCHKWHVVIYKGKQYAIRNIVSEGKRKKQRMHNAILGVKGVDHEDGDGLNNQRYNLRLANQHNNVRNRTKSLTISGKLPSSQYKGVARHSQNPKWTAAIKVDNKAIYLGSFDLDKEVEAAKAYDVAAVKYFGEFAKLNFPKQPA